MIAFSIGRYCQESTDPAVKAASAPGGFIVAALVSSLVLFNATPATARIATITFTGIGQVSGAPGGAFTAANFIAGDVVDMAIQIDELTLDSNGSGTAGTFNDPGSVTTFSRQANPADTVTFTGFGFEMLDGSRLDPASMPNAAEGTYFVSGSLRDWDLLNINPPISDVNDLFTILTELPNAAIGNVAGDGFAIGAPDSTGGNVTQFTSLKPIITLTLGCGNGTVDPGEGCDDALCCDAMCNGPAVPDGTECRASADVCDAPETCASGVCPADVFLPSGTECRVSLGDCDMAEECTGSSVECPPDTLSQFTCGTICRPSQDVCDAPDFCGSFADTGNFDCPGSVTLCTPTATPTGTPTATSTSTATATRVPEGGACADTGECEIDLACLAGTCTDVAVPAPATSKTGLLLALSILLLAAYTVMRRNNNA